MEVADPVKTRRGVAREHGIVRAFAQSLGGGELIISYVLPVFSKWQMLLHGNEGYVKMTNVSASQVKKQVGEGDSATLVTCSPGTIAKEIG